MKTKYPIVFQDKYRIPSNRLSGWDYDINAHYFITIVTHNRYHLFGTIVNGEMKLNDIGDIVCTEFFKSFVMREELSLGGFVIMPNHIHMIVTLQNVINNIPQPITIAVGCPVETHCRASQRDVCNTNIFRETHGRASLQAIPSSINPTSPGNMPFRLPRSISSFIAGFKSAAIRGIDDWIDTNNINMPKFGNKRPLWQSNYYDHIIRSKEEFDMILEYIRVNPLYWDMDNLKNVL